MKDEEEVLTGEILYNLKSVVSQLVFTLGGSFLTFFLAPKFNYPAIAIVVFLSFLLLPFLFNTQIKKYFSRTIKIIFNKSDFTFEIYSLNTDTLERSIKYNYADVAHCKLNAKQDKYSIVTFILRDSTKFTFTFFDQNDNVNTSEILYWKLAAYSEMHEKSNEITLKPNVLATKKGATILWIAVAIMAVLIVAQIFYAPKSTPYSLLITMLLLLNIFLRRKAELDMVKKNS